jgi:universal stress protein A
MSGRYACILIAVDASDDAEQVLQAATDLDRKADGAFHVVTVIPPMMDGVSSMGGASFAAALPLKDMESSLTREISTGVSERAARFGIPPERVAVLYGRPAAEIQARAEQLSADLIVVGSHARRGLARVVLGSTANAVLHGAACDVLTVRIREWA